MKKVNVKDDRKHGHEVIIALNITDRNSSNMMLRNAHIGLFQHFLHLFDTDAPIVRVGKLWQTINQV